MKEKNKGMHIAILIICIVLYLFIFMLMGPLRAMIPAINPFVSQYIGVMSIVLVLITTTMVTTNGKRGYIASIVMCVLSVYSAVSAMIRDNSMGSLPGIITPVVNMITMTVILTYINTNQKQNQELNEQYEQIMDKNREMEEKDEALRVYAYKDLLTGMYNLRHFREQLEVEAGAAHPDDDEFVAAEWVELDVLIDSILDGRIEDSKTVIAALLVDAIRHRV